MHPVAHFAHSLKRLFTTCRVFSGSFTGKASIQRAIQVNTVHCPTHHEDELVHAWKMQGGAGKQVPWLFKSFPTRGVALRNLNLLRVLTAPGSKPPLHYAGFNGLIRKRNFKQMKQIKVALLPPPTPSVPFNLLQNFRSRDTFCLWLLFSWTTIEEK